MIVQIYIEYWNFNKFFALFLLIPFQSAVIKIPVAGNHRRLYIQKGATKQQTMRGRPIISITCFLLLHQEHSLRRLQLHYPLLLLLHIA